MNDYKEIDSWFKARGMKAPDPRFLPALGLIVPFAAAGFLIKTDCRFGILDFFISNPDADKLSRSNALEEIASKLIFDATLAGLKAVKCDTKFDNIKRLANKLNFTYLGEASMFVKEL